VVERAPKFGGAHAFLAWTYVELDRLDDARDAIKTVLELAPHSSLKKFDRTVPIRVDEDRNRYLDGMRKAGLPEG
jgi:adenylate cyclase